METTAEPGPNFQKECRIFAENMEEAGSGVLFLLLYLVELYILNVPLLREIVRILCYKDKFM